MKYIEEDKIQTWLKDAQGAPPESIDAILKKSRKLERLTLPEAAALLAAQDKGSVDKILQAAAFVKEKVYGARIVLFAPLYISNRCANNCLYCAFKSDNNALNRKSLSMEEIRGEVRCLLSQGHKRILMVSGEFSGDEKENVAYYEEAVAAIYSVCAGPHKVRRANVNCAPLSVEGFKRLKAAGIGTYQLFQETYHEATYRRVHPRGPKSDPDNRIAALERAFEAGIDDLGIGVLYGLYDHKFETLALLSHVAALEEKFGVGPHTISVPRIEPALGVDFEKGLFARVSDEEFRKLVAILRLAVPYTGLILSTRESQIMRDELFSLGISQVSAGSRTSPGGYGSGVASRVDDGQFMCSDKRTLDEIAASLIQKGCIPSFCAACYRKARTGEVFMDLAKPGTIKGKCQFNALVTLKEYLDDFAGPAVKRSGTALIEKMKADLDPDSLKELTHFYDAIENGTRDAYV